MIRTEKIGNWTISGNEDHTELIYNGTVMTVLVKEYENDNSFDRGLSYVAEETRAGNINSNCNILNNGTAKRLFPIICGRVNGIDGKIEHVHYNNIRYAIVGKSGDSGLDFYAIETINQ